MKLTHIALAFAGVSTLAFAQPTPAAPAPAAPAAPAPAVEAAAAPAPQPVDPAKLALARDVVAAMKVDKIFDPMVNHMKQLAAQSTVLPNEATPDQRKKAEEIQGKIIDLSMETAKGLLSHMDEIYATVYSDAELKAIKAFYTSPEGEAVVTKQPQIMSQLMPFVQQAQRDLMPKIQALVQEARADQTPKAPAATATPAPAAPAAPAVAPTTSAAPKPAEAPKSDK
jgi:hypothetical protein